MQAHGDEGCCQGQCGLLCYGYRGGCGHKLSEQNEQSVTVVPVRINPGAVSGAQTGGLGYILSIKQMLQASAFPPLLQQQQQQHGSPCKPLTVGHSAEQETFFKQF